MSKIKIDDREFEIDYLSDDAKAQLASLQFVDKELQRLNQESAVIAAQTAVLQTARVAYSNALREALPPAMGETIKFT